MKLKVLAAALILSGQVWAAGYGGVAVQNFDKTVRVQDDIYRAVNGTWLDSYEIPAAESWAGAFKDLRDLSESRSRELIESAAADKHAAGDQAKIGALYRGFMDEAAIEKQGLLPLRDDIRSISLISNRGELFGLVAKWQDRAGQIRLPLAFSVSVDAKDAKSYLAELEQSGLAMPDRDYYLSKDPRFVKARAAYQAHLQQVFTLAGYAQPAKRAAKVLALETKIAQIQRDKVQNRDPQKRYNKMSPAQLAKLAPGLDWHGFLAGAGAKDLPQLNIAQPEYLSALAVLLKKEPLINWQDYLVAHLLDGYSNYLSKAWVDAKFEFYGKALTGAKEQQPRWKRGVRLVEGSLGEVVGKEYVARYFSEQDKAKAQELVSNLMKAYSQSIDGLSWMGPETKLAARDKLSKYSLKIGYPDQWRDYGGLDIAEDDLLGNVKRAVRFEYARDLARLGKPVDRKEWFMTPQTVNAYYNPNMNEIVFPAAILQPPFFDPKADDAVNYGGIGAVIGHEISHGFDDQGSQFDGDGNLRNWWTAEDRARFTALTNKLVAQFDAYEPLPGKHINGKLTLGENIADLSGLQVAYKAYQVSLGGQPAPVIDGMTGDQRFFYGFAQIWRGKEREAFLLSRLASDPHSPDAFRAIGASINSDAFQKAFDVKPGDKMYKPEDQRIRIW
ncbi:M13 family metallopeptidase [Chromobacterium sp. IIBBL 290-4]|uniref:M13 family metallopeptidase n=1 Tax=Chromobacterium sp. IIBBL 290-4 TaxID=2953890 RepID=UPI0020B7E055|nr:M13 family metallopeptidase [Chromobacterium sp. IIBBL 290-4]UTH73104.1 M13 family metallopeptidase [Chromobacterium sp. IIBBL 290-4]